MQNTQHSCNGSVFGDKRLDKRLEKTIETLSASPEKSVPEASKDFFESKGIYNLWDNPKTSEDKILLQHKESTFQALESTGEDILVIQDTTDINYTSLKETKGLGYTSNQHTVGLMGHSTIAVTSTGIPIGILDQKLWTRDYENYGTRYTRKIKTIDVKESYRWVKTQELINELIQTNNRIIHIADRESDIFDFISAKRSDNQYILIRFVHNRRIDHEKKKLKDALSNEEEKCKFTIEIGRKGNNPARKAELRAKFLTTELQPPTTGKQREGQQPVKITAIKVYEKSSPHGTKPIEWYLMTTMPIENQEDVEQCVRYYSYRWLIERFHYVLKSGCKIEDLQLKDVQNLKNAIATYSIVAFRTMVSAYMARKEPESDASKILTEDEILALRIKYKKKEEHLTIKDAVIMIAKLGGFLSRKNDGMPGVKTLWRGYMSLYSLLEGIIAAKKFYGL